MVLRNLASPFQLTPTGLSPSMAGRSRPLRLHWRGATRPGPQPHIPLRFPGGVWFGLFPFRSPLLRESRLVSFPPPTWMFPFGGFPLPAGSTAALTGCGRRSHSGIPGSTAACAYPGLIAACHALRRRSSRAIHQTAWRVGPTWCSAPDRCGGPLHGVHRENDFSLHPSLLNPRFRSCIS